MPLDRKVHSGRRFALPEGVGNTPLRRLRDLEVGLSPDVQLWVKCEQYNVGGSSKARAASYMLSEALASGELRKGQTILLPTSGNTGVACAIEASRRRLSLTLVMSETVSAEKRALATYLNADVLLSPADEGSDGAYRVAQELWMSDPNRYYFLDQYSASANWLAHYHTTGPEIWIQTSGQITHFICGVGTSGTIIGTGRFLKESDPSIQVIAAGPACAMDVIPGLRNLQVQVVPRIYDASVIDLNLPIEAECAWRMAMDCALDIGLMVGPSSGAAIYAALQVACELERGIVVALAPDGIEKYVSAFPTQSVRAS